MSRRILHIQRPTRVTPPTTKVEHEYYLCQCCFHSVPCTDFAALADSSNPIVPHCMNCSMRACCIEGCNKPYDSEYICSKKKIPFKTCCNKHRDDTHQCHHSVNCTNTTDGLFCDEHRCQGHMNGGRPCFAERVPGKQYCAVHVLQVSETTHMV